MNVVQTHSKIVVDYAINIRSFLKIVNPAIRSFVERVLEQGKPKQDENYGDLFV